MRFGSRERTSDAGHTQRREVPYSNRSLHEVVFSDRDLPNDCHTLDVAKRLIDFGYHPPTIYFPLVVKGAIMIEPTETESQETLDEFCDAMLAIAKEFNIKSETILYVNTQLEDNPHNLRPGMELTIPPVDGLYYERKPDDTVEAVAAKFDAEPENILNFPGNDLDLTNPVINPGTKVMIPGGSRELRNGEADLVTASRSNTGSTGGQSAGYPH